jgi:hypothetical protein
MWRKGVGNGEHGNEPSGSGQRQEIHVQLNDWELLLRPSKELRGILWALRQLLARYLQSSACPLQNAHL